MRTFTVEEISQIVGGMLTKVADAKIAQIAPPLLADENTLALALGEDEIANLPNSNAKAALVPLGVNFDGISTIEVERPRLAFMKLLNVFYIAPDTPRNIHPTAVIDPTAKLGNNVSIGANVFVGRNTVIGDNTALMPNVYIGKDVNGRDIIIVDDMIASGSSMIEVSEMLKKRGCKKVYLIHRRDSFRAAKTLVTALSKYENIELVLDSVVDEIHGEDMVEAVSVHNVKNGEAKKLEVNGVFLAVGTKPNSELFSKLVKTTESGWIEADETCKTSCPGIYAVGDVRTKQLRQVITAAADGANAITSIEHYLAEL